MTWMSKRRGVIPMRKTLRLVHKPQHVNKKENQLILSQWNVCGWWLDDSCKHVME